MAIEQISRNGTFWQVMVSMLLRIMTDAACLTQVNAPFLWQR